MHVNHYRHYSHNLGREMEFLVYGHGGRPIVVFPAQDGRFYDFYNFGMVDAAAECINQGKISNEGKSYCYATVFNVNGTEYNVVANDKTKSIMFYVTLRRTKQ